MLYFIHKFVLLPDIVILGTRDPGIYWNRHAKGGSVYAEQHVDRSANRFQELMWLKLFESFPRCDHRRLPREGLDLS